MNYEPGGRLDGAPVGDIFLDEAIVPVLDGLAERLPKGGRADAYMEMLRRAWTPGVRWTDAFSRQMAALLSPRGLVILDPRWDGVKRLFAHIMRAELTDPLASTVLVNEAADRIERAGAAKGRSADRKVPRTSFWKRAASGGRSRSTAAGTSRAGNPSRLAKSTCFSTPNPEGSARRRR